MKIRVDTMIGKGFRILVGDANGADKAVQSYLAEKAYPNVVVHCMEHHCRNNVGQWPAREVPAPKGARGFDFYSAKDRVMAAFRRFLWPSLTSSRFTRRESGLHGRPLEHA